MGACASPDCLCPLALPPIEKVGSHLEGEGEAGAGVAAVEGVGGAWAGGAWEEDAVERVSAETLRITSWMYVLTFLVGSNLKLSRSAVETVDHLSGQGNSSLKSLVVIRGRCCGLACGLLDVSLVPLEAPLLCPGVPGV